MKHIPTAKTLPEFFRVQKNSTPTWYAKFGQLEWDNVIT